MGKILIAKPRVLKLTFRYFRDLIPHLQGYYSVVSSCLIKQGVQIRRAMGSQLRKIKLLC